MQVPHLTSQLILSNHFMRDEASAAWSILAAVINYTTTTTLRLPARVSFNFSLEGASLFGITSTYLYLLFVLCTTNIVGV
jgi:hypothetical protein